MTNNHNTSSFFDNHENNICDKYGGDLHLNKMNKYYAKMINAKNIDDPNYFTYKNKYDKYHNVLYGGYDNSKKNNGSSGNMTTMNNNFSNGTKPAISEPGAHSLLQSEKTQPSKQSSIQIVQRCFSPTAGA